MRLLVLLILAIPAISFGQIISVDFEDDDLTGWYENITSRWHIDTVDAIQGNHTLKHAYDNTDAGCDWIAFFHKPLDIKGSVTTWEFSVRYNYAPSSFNNWAVFLISSDLPYKANDIEHALIFGVNFRGNNDELALWEQNHEDVECILPTGYNWQNNITPGQIVSFRIESSTDGRLSVYIDTSGSSYTLLGISGPTEMTTNSCLIINYKYTSTYDQGLSFDNLKISGNMLPDNLPPNVNNVQVQSPTQIKVQFSEIINVNSPGLFCVEGQGCDETNTNIGRIYNIKLPFAMHPGQQYNLTLPLMSDMSGNNISENDQNFQFYYPGTYDIVINEVMADPKPAVLLPEKEYVELFNRTDKIISLEGWHFSVNNYKVTLPFFYLKPGEFVILCNKDPESVFDLSPDKILRLKDFPAISNESCNLLLTDASNKLIHSVNYSNNWFGSSDKKDGGWSLEMINHNEPCLEYENWKASDSRSGGTPGKCNSVIDLNTQNQPPELYRASIIELTTLILQFSEPVDSNSVINPQYYSVNNEMGNPDSIFTSFPLVDKVYLKFNKNFENNKIYNITLTSDIYDCSGKPIYELSSVDFSLSSAPQPSDIVINEIMYEPEEGENEYIELFNTSSKYINLKDWQLCIGDSLKNIKKLTDDHFTMSPNSYIVLSKDPGEITKTISFKKSLLIMPNLGTLSNTGNIISLFDSSGNLIDMVRYGPDFHHQVINNTHGISLERITPAMPGDDPDNWQSASSDAGYKTPAAINSQYKGSTNGNEVNINPYTITPNGDGVDDVLEISYILTDPGFMGRILIFDIEGNLIVDLLNGGILGIEGTYHFDGNDFKGNRLPTGYYIIYFEAYSPNMNSYKEKKTFVIANTQ